MVAGLVPSSEVMLDMACPGGLARLPLSYPREWPTNHAAILPVPESLWELSIDADFGPPLSAPVAVESNIACG